MPIYYKRNVLHIYKNRWKEKNYLPSHEMGNIAPNIVFINDITVKCCDSEVVNDIEIPEQEIDLVLFDALNELIPEIK